MKILKGLLSLLLCLCLITPMGSAIVALNEGGIANMGSQTNSGSPTSAPSVTPAPSDTDTPVEAPDYAALYNDLMAAATFAEAHALLEGLTDEQLSAFIDSLTEEQYAALEEHINELIAAAEEDGDLEYVYTTVNFTNVAPLLDPVCGSPTRGASVSDDEAGSGNGDSGMVITKNAVANEDGTYTITLEAYATGSQIITEVTEDIPTDIVLVLDQSGSMDFCIVCGNEMDGKNDYHNTYVEATQINTNKTYYIKNGSTYSRVYYCNGRHLFSQDHEAGWYVSDWNHTSSNRIAPKTESNPDGVQFYLLDGQEPCSSRLNALKVAVTAFADAVAGKAKGKDGTLETADDVNHRIAVVGFAAGKYPGYDYDNTEVFIGDSEYKYGAEAQNVYGSAFQDMSTAAGQKNITDSINVLDAYGGTLTNLGMEMANGILNANPVPEGKQRNRVIIVFTDGAPGRRGYDSDIADAAISQASTAKEKRVTVYTVGIFSGADATSAGNSDGNDTQKANWFMQNLSSNNGNVQSPSYYLSAGDADALNDIFEKISQQIETGGSSTNLSSATVIRDIIAPAFTLPEGATADSITLETWKYNGPDRDWTKNADAMGATATLNGDQVSVTGFDFAKHYVGTVTDNGVVTSYRGHKLVISFTVSPKAGFLGGNNVYTNTSAGVYENSTAINPVLTFERPEVNVPIGKVSVTASEKNVYLLNGLTADDLRNGLRVKVGEVMLDLSEFSDSDDPQTINVIEVDEDGEPVIGEDGKPVSFPIEPWQTEYVNISVDITDQNGNTITDFTALTADNSYSVSVTVSPKTDGSGASGKHATAKSGNEIGAINVFKPVLTFADSEVWYGGQYTANYKSVAWKHGETVDSSVTMEGSAPTLTLGYTTTPENAIVESYIVVPDDIPVNVSVKIGDTAIDEHVKFEHVNCSHENCGFDAEACKFILHVKTCSLTVEKAIAEGSQLQDSDQSFIFKVHYQGIPDGEGTIIPSADYNVLIVGAGSRTIVGLPVGTYTVSEDANWSWRYKLEESTNNTAVLSAENSTATVTMTNRLNNEFWLSDEAVAKNVFNSNDSPEYSPMPAIIPGKEDLTDEAD